MNQEYDEVRGASKVNNLFSSSSFAELVRNYAAINIAEELVSVHAEDKRTEELFVCDEIATDLW